MGDEYKRYFKIICDNQMRPETIYDFHCDKITGGKVAKFQLEVSERKDCLFPAQVHGPPEFCTSRNPSLLSLSLIRR